ncbi:MAG: YcgN family cysteine cluster protein [Mariprofundus sp.]
MFWEDKTLTELTKQEWESLCDGCGRCCVWKFEDEDSHEILYTDIRCHQFNDSSCRCIDYPRRATIVPECMDIRTLADKQYAWLPDTCAYRLRHEGKPLFDWHPLIAGDKTAMHTADISLQHGTTSPEGITEEDIIHHIIDPDKQL